MLIFFGYYHTKKYQICLKRKETVAEDFISPLIRYAAFVIRFAAKKTITTTTCKNQLITEPLGGRKEYILKLSVVDETKKRKHRTNLVHIVFWVGS